MIRPAAETDAGAIAAIWNAVIRDTAITFTTEEKTKAGIGAMIAGGRAAGARVFVADEGGAVLGFSCHGQFRAGPGYARCMEHSIHLAPGARGRGLGRALLLATEAEAAAGGAHSMIAGISGENQAGVAFHAAMGYRKIAILPEVGNKFGRWMDLVLMQKFLD